MSILGNIFHAIFGAFTQPLTRYELDVELDKRAKANPEKLDWRNSIVDLMKLTNQDSSLEARKELAKELGYTGSLDGSADMNIWLHSQVMTKLADQLK